MKKLPYKTKHQKIERKGIATIFLPITILNPQQGPTTPVRNNAPVTVQVSNPNDSIINMQGEINMWPDVDGMTQTIISAAGGGALAKTVYFLNEDTFNASPTDNGSGANSITNTYGDGTTLGKGYNQMVRGMSATNGMKCYGFTLQFQVTATGAQDTSGLNNAAPTWLMANLVGANFIPKGFVLSTGSRNTQYLSGVMTVKGSFNLNTLNQISYKVPAGDTSTMTVLTKPF